MNFVDKNDALIIGIVEVEPYFFYSDEEKFYFFEMKVGRNNKKNSKDEFDYIRICISESLLKKYSIIKGKAFAIKGNVKTKDRKYKKKNKVEVFVYAKSISFVNNFDKNMYTNICKLSGYVCKKSKFPSPYQKGSKLEIILANNFSSNDTSYIPCAIYGKVAYELNTNAKIGTYISLTSRIQSINYTRNEELLTSYELLVYKKYMEKTNNI